MIVSYLCYVMVHTVFYLTNIYDSLMWWWDADGKLRVGVIAFAGTQSSQMVNKIGLVGISFLLIEQILHEEVWSSLA